MDHLMIQWSMKYSEDFVVYVSVDAESEPMYLYYTPVDYDNLGSGDSVHHGLGSNSTDGTWWTFTRDLLADLHDAQPTVGIIDVNYFLIYGSGYVDNILLLIADSDAELAVPTGTSYLTASMPSHPVSDRWYQAQFVRPLDRPFRLYQLSEFSVHASVVQASNRMGKTFIGLFDNQMKCTLWIYFGDSWGYETKGYMYTTYYPESGGSYSQSAVDITTSFGKTAGLWYDRDSNSIRSAIDGNVVTLGPAYNASRIVSYIVIMTQRYDGWTLLDMRVHEISVLASVRATAPWMPVTPPDEEPLPQSDDGTATGSVESESWIGQALLTAALSLAKIFWNGPWPQLNYQYTSPAYYPAALGMMLHVAVSLLHEITVVVFTVADEMTALLDDFQSEIIEGLLEWVATYILAGIALAAWRSLEFNPLAGVATLAVAVVFSILALAGPALGANLLIDNGVMSAGTIAGILFLMALTMLFMSFGDILVGYLALIATALLYTPWFCAAWYYLVAVSAGSIIVKIFEFLFAVAWLMTAAQLLIHGRVILV